MWDLHFKVKAYIFGCAKKWGKKYKQEQERDQTLDTEPRAGSGLSLSLPRAISEGSDCWSDTRRHDILQFSVSSGSSYELLVGGYISRGV